MLYDQFRAMNSDIVLAASGDDASLIKQGFSLARLFFQLSEQRFTRFTETSELAELNRRIHEENRDRPLDPRRGHGRAGEAHGLAVLRRCVAAARRHNPRSGVDADERVPDVGPGGRSHSFPQQGRALAMCGRGHCEEKRDEGCRKGHAADEQAGAASFGLAYNIANSGGGPGNLQAGYTGFPPSSASLAVVDPTAGLPTTQDRADYERLLHGLLLSGKQREGNRK